MASKYLNMEDHDILLILADSSDRQERHLEKINTTLQNHEKRLLAVEIRRQVEEETGLKPPSKKRKLAIGGMYGGAGALIVSILYALWQIIQAKGGP